MYKYFLQLFCIFNTVIFVQCQNTTEVQTNYGKIKGYVTPFGEKTVTKFLGIPFAKPPVGSLRFQKPEKIAPWSGVLDAKDYSASCVQIRSQPNQRESEDCLYLNVVIPGSVQDAKANPKAVMVWIYGGGYTVGNANTYPGEVISSFHDVVVVTFNYRLALFGFMSTEDGTIPGNMGLYDQLTVLQWVNENIASFGGDVSKITIFGESAGADSVVQHLLSPLSEKFFQRAIIQSFPGMPVAQRAVQVSQLRQILSSACQDASKKIAECVQNLSAEKLAEFGRNSEAVLYPYLIVDGEFITDFLEKKLMSGDFDRSKEVIIGFNGDDGDMTLRALFDWQNIVKYGLSNYQEVVQSTLIPTSLLFHRYVEKPNAVIMGNLIHQKYLSCVENPLEAARGVLDIATDAVFISKTFKLANAYALQGAKIYLYKFDHFSTYLRDEMKPMMKLSAGHAAEIPYVFGYLEFFKSQKKNVTDSETWLSYSISKAFTTFAKTGQPVYATHTRKDVQWRPYTYSNMTHLKFTANMTEQSLQQVPKNLMDRVSLWNEVIFGIESMETCDPYTMPDPRPPTGKGTTLPILSEVYLVVLAALSLMATL